MHPIFKTICESIFDEFRHLTSTPHNPNKCWFSCGFCLFLGEPASPSKLRSIWPPVGIATWLQLRSRNMFLRAKWLSTSTSTFKMLRELHWIFKKKYSWKTEGKTQSWQALFLRGQRVCPLNVLWSLPAWVLLCTLLGVITGTAVAKGLTLSLFREAAGIWAPKGIWVWVWVSVWELLCTCVTNSTEIWWNSKGYLSFWKISFLFKKLLYWPWKTPEDNLLKIPQLHSYMHSVYIHIYIYI